MRWYSEGSALWAKLDTGKKKYVYVCGYLTIQAKNYQH